MNTCFWMSQWMGNHLQMFKKKYSRFIGSILILINLFNLIMICVFDHCLKDS